jgi:hypothetical protein
VTWYPRALSEGNNAAPIGPETPLTRILDESLAGTAINVSEPVVGRSSLAESQNHQPPSTLSAPRKTVILCDLGGLRFWFRSWF